MKIIIIGTKNLLSNKEIKNVETVDNPVNNFKIGNRIVQFSTLKNRQVFMKTCYCKFELCRQIILFLCFFWHYYIKNFIYVNAMTGGRSVILIALASPIFLFKYEKLQVNG